MDSVITHKQITEAISQVVPRYNVKSVSYFGSFAAGTQTKDSDLDLLVELYNPYVSLYDLIELEMEIEEKLSIPVDIATFPPPKGSKLIIDNKVSVYGS